MNALRKQKGFTLVESLMSGIMFASIAGVILTFFKMQNNETVIAAANLNLQMTATFVKEQISRDIRRANRVLAPDENWTREITVMDPVNSSEMYLFDTAGTIFAAYQLSNGFLFEARHDPPVVDGRDIVYQKFSLGEKQVTATEDGYFYLSFDRQLMELNIELTLENSTGEYKIPLTGTPYRCRN